MGIILVSPLFKTKSLRDRLTLAYACALLSGFIVFSVVLIIILRVLEQHILDQELFTIDNAVASIVEVHQGRMSVEESDRKQFHAIADQTNTLVVTASMNTLLHSGAPVPGNLLASGLPTQAGLITISDGHRRIRAMYIPIRSKDRILGVAVAWQSYDEITRFETLALVACVLATILISIPAIATSRIITTRNLKHLERITHEASMIEEHDTARRLGVTESSTDELTLLTVTINRMLDRLEGAFNRQKQFTADASHELRTPLSIILAETELALRAARTPIEYQQTLVTVAEVSNEMHTLIETLLRAARSDFDQSLYHDTVDVIPLIHLTIERMRAPAQQRSVQITYDGPGEALVIGSAAAISQALNAIVHNAVKFTIRDSIVTIAVTHRPAETHIVITDEGPGFSAAALEHGLKRFWRDDRSRTSGSGFGLGLFLAAAVLAPGAATLSLSNAHGAVVEVRFPRSALTECNLAS